MKRLSFPMRVTPPPCVVPRLTVQNSRKRLPSPMTTSVRSPPNFRSCGFPPTEQNESKTFLRPIRAGPRTTAWGSSTHSSPSSTSSPTTAKEPMRTFWPIRAVAETMARESISLIADTYRVACRRVAGRPLRLAIHEHAAQNGFRRDFTVHRRDRLQLAEFHFPLQHGHFDTQLISGDDRSAKARLIDGGEIKKLLVAFLNLGKQEQATRLRHALDDQHSGHDGFPREMALKVAFVDRDVFDGHNTLEPFDLQDAVHEQERIAMRQYFLNARVVENHCIPQISARIRLSEPGNGSLNYK